MCKPRIQTILGFCWADFGFKLHAINPRIQDANLPHTHRYMYVKCIVQVIEKCPFSSILFKRNGTEKTIKKNKGARAVYTYVYTCVHVRKSS